MSAYNIVHTTAACSRCGTAVPASVQFKFGDTSQCNYAVGDAVRWGGNDNGKPTSGLVAVDGVAALSCGACGKAEERDFYVWIDNNKIVRVAESDGTIDFIREGKTYVTVREH